MDRIEQLVSRWETACVEGNSQEKYRAAILLCDLEEKNRTKMRFSSNEKLVFQEARMFLGK